MKNVTLSLEEELARWVRIQAAEQELSLSRYVAGLLRERMERDRSYERAMRSNLKREPLPLKRGGRYPTRMEIHDRAGVRR